MSVFPPLKDGIGPVRIHHPPAASSSPALNPLRYPQATNETNSCLSAGRSSLSWHCALSTPPPLPEYLWYTTNASTLEFGLLVGFATLTCSKRICSWSHGGACPSPKICWRRYVHRQLHGGGGRRKGGGVQYAHVGTRSAPTDALQKNSERGARPGCTRPCCVGRSCPVPRYPVAHPVGVSPRKMGDDLARGGDGGDVALDAVHLPDQGHRLQVHGDYPSLLARTCDHEPEVAQRSVAWRIRSGFRRSNSAVFRGQVHVWRGNVSSRAEDTRGVRSGVETGARK
mmetsp:Transcript_16037/g.31941  ORF Transcript_16037/g.31941 Transcript_16037/m.31941 type:complete len:284 (-) Transcript_16037:111-962(-)